MTTTQHTSYDGSHYLKDGEVNPDMFRMQGYLRKAAEDAPLLEAAKAIENAHSAAIPLNRLGKGEDHRWKVLRAAIWAIAAAEEGAARPSSSAATVVGSISS